MFQLFQRRRRTQVPALFIVGAQKCGTTSLWYQLSQHPEIRTARDPETGEVIKELGFFAGARRQDEGRSTDEQRALFESYFEGDAGPRMDATPEYLTHLDQHSVISEAYPDAQILISLRNPVERAFSHYNHFMQMLPEAAGWDWMAPGESFARNVELELQNHDPSNPSSRGLVSRGHYALQVRNLLRHYPREQVRVVIMERWSRNPRALHYKLERELGIQRKRLSKSTRHRRPKTVDPMDPETRARLYAHFRSYNKDLEDLLGETIPEWQEA